MQFIGVSAEKAAFLVKLWQKLNTPAEGYTFAFTEGAEFTVEKQGNCINITCTGDTQQYRSLLLAAQLISGQKEGKITQVPQFEHTGIMLDMSRAGVMQVSAVKEYMEYMALCGLNRLMLYMEDVYTLEDYEYFGYMRGRYSCKDLKEIDVYGQKCGIEVIPCMQTLGHMEQYLKWREGKPLAEDESVLLPDSEATYAFIEKMISTLAGCFTSKKMHIGMDEAYSLGRGTHLTKYGYELPFQIFSRHLARVKEITDRYGLEPMIWSDMYFRLHSEKHIYCDPDIVLPPEARDLIPKGVTLVYWDYYRTNPELYRAMLRKHFDLCDTIAFAGGIWLWRGLLPDHEMTFDTTNAALPICKEMGVKDVYATLWGDDGAETDPLFGLAGVVLYGEHAWQAQPQQADIDTRMRLLLGADMADFYDLSYASMPLTHHVDGGGFPRLCLKSIVYSDILCGLADADMQDERLVPHYKALAQKFSALAQQEGVLQTNFAYAAAICRLAMGKVQVSQQLLAGYKQDRSLLYNVKDVLLPQLFEDYNTVKELHYQMWHKIYRPFGFEVVDTRYGGVIARIQTATRRLEAYLSGKTDALPELEEVRLLFSGQGRAHSYNALYSAYNHR